MTQMQHIAIHKMAIIVSRIMVNIVTRNQEVIALMIIPEHNFN